MLSEEIRLELFKRRKVTNLSKVARGLDPPVTHSAVSQVIDRKWTSRRIMEAVAATIGKDVKYVFPELIKKAD